MRAALLLITFLVSSACQSAPVNKNYPPEWWAPVERKGAPAWEILPQDAGPGEVILSKRNELGILSNFAPTPFLLDGKTYGSMEGFWQMMKYPEGPGDERLKDHSIRWPFTREQVGAMTAFDAKNAGSQANAIMKQLGIDWVTYQGHKMRYLEKAKSDFYNVILRGERAKLEQNLKVKEILLKTGDLKLRPDHKQSPDDAPAWKYYDIWMEVRAELQKQP